MLLELREIAAADSRFLAMLSTFIKASQYFLPLITLVSVNYTQFRIHIAIITIVVMSNHSRIALPTLTTSKRFHSGIHQL
jgi:hypothetical protein